MRVSIITLLFICVLLSSCKSLELHGQFVDNNQIKKLNSKLEAENLLKEEVINDIGYPSFTDTNNEQTWYYVFRVLSKKAWFKPNVEEQRIVKILFNDKNLVTEIKLIQNEHRDKNIKVINEYTKLDLEQGAWKNLSKSFMPSFYTKKKTRYKKSK